MLLQRNWRPYNREDIETSVTECNKLKEQGMLFTKDIYENVIEEFTKNRQTVVKALVPAYCS